MASIKKCHPFDEFKNLKTGEHTDRLATIKVAQLLTFHSFESHHTDCEL